jgi:hypothetical protein
MKRIIAAYSHYTHISIPDQVLERTYEITLRFDSIWYPSKVAIGVPKP